MDKWQSTPKQAYFSLLFLFMYLPSFLCKTVDLPGDYWSNGSSFGGVT